MKYVNLYQVTLLSVGFCFLFTAFFTCQNFAAKVFQDDGFAEMGFTSVAVLYLTFAIVSFFSTPIVNKIGNLAVSMSLGSLCYTAWIVTFLLPSYYSEHKGDADLSWVFQPGFIKAAVIFTAALNGVGAAMLWVSQGKFVSVCATDENKGFFNSYFWAWFQSSQIFGNLIAVWVLRNGYSQSILFIIFSVFSLVGGLIFCTLRVPNQEIKNEGFIKLSDFENSRQSESEHETSDLVKTFRLIKEPRMIQILPIISWSSIINSIYGSIFIVLMTRSMPESQTEDQKNWKALLTMCFLGLGEILGGFPIGLIWDKYGVKQALTAQLFLTVIGVSLVVYVNNRNTFDIWSSVMCFMWGFHDSGLNCIIRCFLGFEFDSKIIPFSVFNFVQSVMIFVFQLISAKIMNPENSLHSQQKALQTYLVCTGIFGLFSVSILFNFKYRSQKTDVSG